VTTTRAMTSTARNRFIAVPSLSVSDCQTCFAGLRAKHGPETTRISKTHSAPRRVDTKNKDNQSSYQNVDSLGAVHAECLPEIPLLRMAKYPNTQFAKRQTNSCLTQTGIWYHIVAAYGTKACAPTCPIESAKIRTGAVFEHEKRGIFPPVTQLGSAPVWGAGGRRFKSCRPDQIKAPG
jgi:hypothetical protein